MKKESPLYIEDVQLCALSFSEKENIGNELHLLVFDNRKDFLIDGTFAGIAAKFDLANSRYYTDNNKGVRRKVSFTLIDQTSRCELAVSVKKVNIPKGNPYITVYAEFNLSDIEFKPGHTYMLRVRDESAASILDETIFHLFGQKESGHPVTWYTVESGGIRPDWYLHRIYRSVKVESYKDLNVRFNLGHNFGNKRPEILPELELRLYYPGEDRIQTRFVEPRTIDFSSNRYFVELPFNSCGLYRGVFYAEVLCMQYPLAGFVFSTTGPEIEGEWYGEGFEPLGEYSESAATDRFNRLVPAEVLSDNDFENALNDFISSQLEKQDEENEPDESDADSGHPDNATEETADYATPLLASLDHLTGLSSVKEKLTIYERIVRFNKMRADNGLPVSTMPLHAMFLGSPGTGKTTVAKLMGIMLRKAGLLSKGHVVIRERATLLGQNYSSESEKTLAAIEEAQGGILLIDEAYQLYQANDPRDPGKFVIETLLSTLADTSKRDWMLILAGYPDEMKRMFDMNPGFKSRIPDSNIYFFDDFTEQELMEIAERHLTGQQYELSPSARTALTERLKDDYCRREKNFGNARHVINMIETEILPAMAMRVTSENTITDATLTKIQATDIPRRNPTLTSSRQRVGFTI